MLLHGAMGQGLRQIRREHLRGVLGRLDRGRFAALVDDAESDMTQGAAESTRAQQLRRPRVEKPSAKRRQAEC